MTAPIAQERAETETAPARAARPTAPAGPAAPARRERIFRALGTEVRLIGGDPQSLAAAETWVHDAHARLSRFEAGSELCALNADPRRAVPVSPLLRAAVAAAVWAARRTGGLVDPTLLGALERAGYDRTFDLVARLPLAVALPLAPARRPARPRRAAGWRAIAVGRLIHRPPGLRLDLGGSAKGWIADVLAARFGLDVVDCGGDVRVNASTRVAVEHPVTGELGHWLDLNGGAVATSGLARRVWMTSTGPAHHLLDPSTGEPAWTGLAGVTALAPTALEAEAIAKAALLAGPAGARGWLARHGGALLHEDATTEVVAP